MSRTTTTRVAAGTVIATMGYFWAAPLFSALAKSDFRLEYVVSAPGHGFAPGTRMKVSLRPEKIVLGRKGEGVAAAVGTVAFHGSHWLYTLTSSLGDLVAVAPNTGQPPHAPGEEVSITWPETALRALPEAA